MKEPNTLNWKPAYRHAHIKPPPKTGLTIETAFPVYEKLKNKLAISKYRYAPAEGWFGDHRHLFSPNGFHYAVQWKPSIDSKWRRLSYEEFCAWYNIQKEVVR